MKGRRRGIGPFVRFMETKGFYLVLTLCVVAVGAAGYMMFGRGTPAGNVVDPEDVLQNEELEIEGPALKEDTEEDDSDDIPTWQYFIGFQVTDVNHGELGEIVAVDDSTMNVLFAIENSDGEEILLPAHEEFIVKLEKKKRKLMVEVPEGLI